VRQLGTGYTSGEQWGDMNIAESLTRREESLVAKLLEKQAGIDDRTGKGIATELVIEQELLRPFLPPAFKSGKGAVVCADRPVDQSPAIDRVIVDSAAASPLIYDETHSIFPIEIVAGMVEITMHLDTTKLRTDIERMIPVKAMTRRRYLIPEPNSMTRVVSTVREMLSPRSFIVGLPADPGWTAKTVAKVLREIQLDLGPPTHVHGLYVIGIGFFSTVPIESAAEPMYRVVGWTGPERIFRFTDSFRQAFDRWGRVPDGCSVDLGCYVDGDPSVYAE
jgi:hypothetical protein